MLISHDSETPADGQQVITACAFVHQRFDGLRRYFAKACRHEEVLPGVYELIGGHIDFAEDPVDGLRREIKEELAMDVEIGDPFLYLLTPIQ